MIWPSVSTRRYGETFIVPRAVTPPVAARVMDLQEPATKMSKSAALAAPGVLRLLDPPDVIRRKIARAVTDSGSDVTFDPAGQARGGQPADDPGRMHRHHPGGGRGAAGHLPRTQGSGHRSGHRAT